MSDRSKDGFFFAVFSGILAAAAGTFGKVAMNPQDLHFFCENIVNQLLQVHQESLYFSCLQISFVFRLVAFFSMLAVNVLMWTTFLKALRFSATSLEAVMTNTGTNFLISAILGYVLFGESNTILHWLGNLLIFIGFLFIHRGCEDTAQRFPAVNNINSLQKKK